MSKGPRLPLSYDPRANAKAKREAEAARPVDVETDPDAFAGALTFAVGADGQAVEMQKTSENFAFRWLRDRGFI